MMDEEKLRAFKDFEEHDYRQKYLGKKLEDIPILAYIPQRQPLGWYEVDLFKSAERGTIIPIKPNQEVYFMMMPQQEWARNDLTQLLTRWEDRFNGRALFRAEIQYPLMVNDKGMTLISSGTHVPRLMIPTQEEYTRQAKKELKPYKFSIGELNNDEKMELFRRVLFDHSRMTSLSKAIASRPW